MAEDQQRLAMKQGVSSKGEGRGYGLAMVKTHVESLGGSLALYSTLGRGTLIEVTVPYAMAVTRVTDGVT